MTDEKAIKIEEIVKDMERNFSSFTDDEINKFFNEFTKVHRTNQQRIMSFLVGFLLKLSSDDYKTDARNKATHDMAKKFISGFGLAFEKQIYDQFLEEFGEEDYAQKKAKEYKESFDRNPSIYMGLPFI